MNDSFVHDKNETNENKPLMIKLRQNVYGVFVDEMRMLSVVCWTFKQGTFTPLGLSISEGLIPSENKTQYTLCFAPRGQIV